LPFQSERFKTTWAAWVEHRKLNGKKMTPYAQKLAFDKLPTDEAKAIAWIEHSLANGWQGIYEPKPNGVSSSRPPAPSSAPPQRGIQEIITARLI
jgi:hypothetical protein